MCAAVKWRLMISPRSPLEVRVATTGTVTVLAPQGILDTTTYLQLRDAIVKAALDEPGAVLVDVHELGVPAPSAWVVFTSARWLVNTWPAIPIHLVCASAERRRTIARNGVTRYMGVHPTVEDALAALGTPLPRLRASVELPAVAASLRSGRKFVAHWLTNWARTDFIPVATVVANVFIENVLQYTTGGLALVLETRGESISVAVRDDSSVPAARHEDSHRGGEPVSGLAIVASLSRAWGSAPGPPGKMVWAVIGPENRL
jgi:hypothetical protein